MCAVLRQGSISSISSMSAMAVAVLFLAGCSQTTTPPVGEVSGAAKVSAGPPVLVSGKTAYWPMYKSAHGWASDVVIVRLSAKEVPGFTNDAGKAAMWTASFGSPSRHEYRVDTYAIASALPDIHKGARDGLRLPWGGVTRDAMPIDFSSVTVDSDAAYQSAAADAAAWLKKNPGKKLTAFELGNASKFNVPVWYLMWGDKKSGYVVFVDAMNGKVLKGK